LTGHQLSWTSFHISTRGGEQHVAWIARSQKHLTGCPTKPHQCTAGFITNSPMPLTTAVS